MDISNEQLIANDGVIICPQCLLQARQPVPKTRVTPRTSKSDDSVSSKRKEISFDDTPPARQSSGNTPPPYRGRTRQSSTPNQRQGLSAKDIDTGTARKAPAKKTSAKKKKKAGNKPTTGWGCLGKTVIFTLILFAAYIFFGLLLQALQ